MLFLTGVSEYPAHIITYKSMNWFGRRPVVCWCLFISGLASIAIIYFPKGIYVFLIKCYQNTFLTNVVKGYEDWDIIRIATEMLAKCFITISFCACYNHTAEIFPTVLRGSAVGIANACALLAGMIAPQILHLVKNYNK